MGYISIFSIIIPKYLVKSWLVPNSGTEHSVVFIVVIVGDGYSVFIAFIAFIGASVLHHLLMQSLYSFASVLATAHTIELVDTGADTCVDQHC